MRILMASVLLACLLFHPVVVQAAPNSMEESQAVAKTVCDQVFNAYQNDPQNALGVLISENYLPSKEEFMKAVAANGAKETVFGVEYAVMMALTPADRMIAQIKWDKKYQLKNVATPTLSTGIAVLTFIKENDDWRLLQISGDSPF